MIQNHAIRTFYGTPDPTFIPPSWPTPSMSKIRATCHPFTPYIAQAVTDPHLIHT